MLHWDLDVSIRQMEGELISISSELFGGDPKNPYGVITQGGSESIIMAVLSARNYAKKYKGITEPEMFLFVSFNYIFKVLLLVLCIFLLIKLVPCLILNLER